MPSIRAKKKKTGVQNLRAFREYIPSLDTLSLITIPTENNLTDLIYKLAA